LFILVKLAEALGETITLTLAFMPFNCFCILLTTDLTLVGPFRLSCAVRLNPLAILYYPKKQEHCQVIDNALWLVVIDD
jgi:hypothetical protein